MYYIMSCPGLHPIRRIQKGPDFDGLWRDDLRRLFSTPF